jgi:hypothetical protein
MAEMLIGRLPVISSMCCGADDPGWNEEVSDGRERRNELLQLCNRPQTLPRSFPLSKRQMVVLGPVVQALVRAMLDGRHNPASGCSMGSEQEEFEIVR